MSEELKPCPVPWCESDVLEIIRSPWSRGYGVVCQNCRAQGPSLATKAEAIAAWNHRALDARLATAEAERDREGYSTSDTWKRQHIARANAADEQAARLSEVAAFLASQTKEQDA